MGWDFNMGLMPYGETWRNQRKIFHKAFRPEAAISYRPIQLNSVYALLRSLLESPEDFGSHIKK